MKLWKSPVVYFGIILMLTVTVALVMPLVIDWGRYRESIENFGLRVSGREVGIDGPISARLFPWPRLTLGKVRVANPPNAQNPSFATAERVDLQLSLAGFFNGDIQVESIEITKPVVSFERLATGKGTWQMLPTLLAGDEKMLDSVRLDRIAVTGGTVDLIDGLRGGHARIERLNAQLSAPALAGPWRMRGSASFGENTVDVGFNTGLWKPHEDLKFGFRLAPNNGLGLAYAFDGTSTPAAINGTLVVDTAAAGQGKSNPEGDLRPLAFRSKVNATFDAVNFENIEISPKGGKDSGNLLTGSARIALGSQIDVDAKLKATRFDLDAIASAQARRLLREGSGLSFLQDVLDSLPENVGVKTDVTVTSLVAGGESLENVRLKLDLSADAIRISELSARMPGQSDALFDGVFIVTEKGPQLAGDVALESFNLRDWSKWVWPDYANAIAAKWNGSRGHLKLEARLDAAPGNFRLSNAEFSIDGAMGTGNLNIAGGPRATINLELDADLIDIDNFVPTGAVVQQWQSLIASVGGKPELPNVNVKLKAARLQLNHTEAQNIRANIGLNAAGLNIRQLELHEAGAARLTTSGAVKFGDHGPDGTINADVTADDPLPLLQLAGLSTADKNPTWARALGPSAIKLVYDIQPDAEGNHATVSLQGYLGAVVMAAVVNARSGAGLADTQIAGKGDIKSPSSRVIGSVIGFEPAADIDVPGTATVNIDGSWSNGFSVDAKVTAFGAEFRYSGNVKSAGGSPSFSGRTGVLTEAPQVFFGAIGWSGSFGGLYSAEADLTGDTSSFSFKNIAGLLAGERLSGELSGNWLGSVKGEFAVDSTRLGDLIAASFLPWRGSAPDLSGPFSTRLPAGLTGEIWLKPAKLALFDGFEIAESQIGITADGNSVQLALFGKTAEGQDVGFELRRKEAGSEQQIDGRLSGELSLGKYLLTKDGAPVMDGVAAVDLAWTGKGRTPASVLAGLNGSGSFTAKDVKLARVDVSAFSSSIGKAATAQEVKQSLDTLLGGSGYDLGDISGSLTMTNGTAAFLPSRVAGADADVAIRPLFDVASHSLDLNIELHLNAQPGLPAVEIAYLGEPRQLIRNIDTTGIESTVGMRIVRKGMVELETMQREQQKLLEEEQKQAKEDAEKLAAWEEHRREMQRRVRELKTLRLNWAEQRRQLQERTDSIAPDAQPRGSRASSQAGGDAPGPGFGSPEQGPAPMIPAPKSRPRKLKLVNKASKPAPPAAPEIQVPVVLVPPQLPPQEAPRKPPIRQYNFNR